MSRNQIRRLAFACAWALAVAAAAAVAYRVAFERARAELHAKASQQLAADAGELQSALEKFETLPFVMALDPQVADGLQHPDDRAAVLALDRFLADVQRHARLAAAYVVLPSGLTIAASNWDQAQTFVGNNYRFRPYMRSALEGLTGRFYGIGTTTSAPGYFLAQPVFAPGAAAAVQRPVLGAVVIKLQLDDFERSWANDDDAVALIDANGVLFLGNRPGWKYRSLAPLDADALRAIRETHQYQDQDVTRPLAAVAAGPETDRIAQPVGPLGWRLARFASVEPARRAARSAALAGALLAVIAGLLAFVVVQRRQHARVAAASRQALVEASQRLEERIAARTHDLVAANQDLELRYRQVRDAQQLLRDTQTELIQAGKLGMLGQMAAGVTHELNQPLTAMQVFADNAAAFVERGELAAARENLGHISDACARMGALVGQLKTFARKSQGVPGPVDLALSIENAARLLRNDIEQRGAQLEIRIARPVRVVGDAIRVEQVLINLMRNALDAVGAGAVRRIRVSLDAGTCATVRIADTGPGIPPDVREHLFEPFFTTKPSGAGLGLGLAISSSIVQAMDGALEVARAPEGGAEFILTLPLLETTPAEATAPGVPLP